MALTRDFHQHVVNRLRRDAKLRRIVRREARRSFRTGEPYLARSMLRDLRQPWRPERLTSC